MLIHPIIPNWFNYIEESPPLMNRKKCIFNIRAVPNMTWFEKIFEAHYKDVFFITTRLLNNKNQAEIITQSVFLDAYRESHELLKSKNIRQWLLATTINYIDNELKVF